MTSSEPVRAGLAAVAFLTRIPVGRLAPLDARDVARGAVLFPLVGAAVGGAAGVLADLLVPGVPGLVAGALAVGLAALVTGAMHLDALADMLDALGGTTRERALEIMRDHSIGAFGAVGLCVVCLVNASAIGALAVQNEAWLAGLVAGAVGRAAILPRARARADARGGAGRGRGGAGGRAHGDRAAALLPGLARRSHGRLSRGDGRALRDRRARRVPRRTLMRLVLVRHAEAEESARGRCYGSLDVGLSARGRSQCATLADGLASEHVASVVSSPRIRALETARAIAERHGLGVRVDPAQQERDFGELEGRT